jgi:polysaccharide export outer membrane protein
MIDIDRAWMKPVLSLLLAGFLSALCACARTANSSGSIASDRSQSRFGDGAVSVPGPDQSGEQNNLKSLEALWQSRSGRQAAGDYPIEAGDVLQVSVPAMPEVGERTERVSGDRTISLPLIGEVEAGGLTEEKLRKAIATKLEKYMYRPQVDVFVKEYRSRQVAVVGAVKSPGLLTLASPAETVLEVITRAGGMSGDAADEIIVIPASPSREDNERRISSLAALASETPLTPASTDARPALSAKDAMSVVAGSAQPVVIGLRSTSLSGAGRYLGLPVRPGDVIVVPGGGDVMVVGWVNNPGHFKVGSGLTVLGAIGAAGGPMYAAGLHSVSLVRSEKDGAKRVIPIDLERITHGDESDLAVQGNDVIQVPYSGVKIGPYILYSIVTRMGYGVGIPVP